VRSVINLQQVDPGFDTANLYSMNFHLPQRVYADQHRIEQFADELLRNVRKLPGVTAATVAASAPPQASFMIGQLETDNPAVAPEMQSFHAMNQVRPDYLGLLHIPLMEGRGFDSGSEKRGDVIINAGMARKLWPGTTAAGHRFRFAPPPGVPGHGDWYTVVGVTSDAVVRGLAEDRGAPFVYVPSATGVGFGGFTLVVRTAPGIDIANALRRLSLGLAPSLAPPSVTSIERAFDDSITTQRFTMAVLAIFAVVAVVLSAIGLYGVIAYAVAQRTREIGVRIALGASARQVAGPVMASGLALSVLGLAIGLTGSVWGTKVVQKTLYGVGATDPVSFSLGALLLLAMSLLACVVPMRRAMRVDPLIAMRAE
jgi:predicted permease